LGRNQTWPKWRVVPRTREQVARGEDRNSKFETRRARVSRCGKLSLDKWGRVVILGVGTGKKELGARIQAWSLLFGVRCLLRAGQRGIREDELVEEAVASVELKAGNSESWIAKNGERSRNVFWNQYDRLSGSVTIPDLGGAARATLKKKMLKMRFKATMLLKTKEMPLEQSHFGGSKTFLVGSSAKLCHWKQTCSLQFDSRACGSKPFLRFKAISGKRNVRFGLGAGRLMRKDSDDLIPSPAQRDQGRL